jgi:hypothetical protein
MRSSAANSLRLPVDVLVGAREQRQTAFLVLPTRAGAGRDWDALPILMVLEFGDRNGHGFGMPEGGKGEARMRMLLRDIMLFSCLVAFVAGLVIAAATLLI